MSNDLKNTIRSPQTRFSFGATSAIITNLGIITGMDTLTHPKLSIIGALLAIALADNLSDSFGIHMYQESEHLAKKEVILSTLTNFLTRLFVSFTFIFLIIVLPIQLAAVCLVTWGLLILTILTYTIAKHQKINPFSAIAVHLTIALVVVVTSNFIGAFAISKFQSV
jgi:VIT1/CCC1 family predicted Fe2+/Mn2+ transporter